LQMVLMILGSILVTILGIKALGGVGELKATLAPGFFSMWREANDPEFPWTGILFGAPILGVWYWCTDQFVVQRVLAAHNITEARRGSIFGGLLKMLPLFIFVIPGMICFAMSEKGLLTLSKPDLALPTLMASVLPTGLKGLVIAGLLAALMSSLSSVFNSCSTLITYDFYKKVNPKASEKSLIRFGQIATVILVLFGLAWIPLMKIISGQLFTYLQSVQAYISPPIAAVFLLGIFFKKINAFGAMCSLWTGFILGIGRLILELNKSSLTGVLKSYVSINFLHFALFLFVICSAILIVASLLTSQKKSFDELKDITYNWQGKWKITPDQKLDMGLSIFLVLIIFITWFIFS